MLSNSHRLNSDFALRYFISGSCTTADGAWSLLYGQKIDMISKLNHGATQKLRLQAKQAKVAESVEDTAEYYEALAELQEAEANEVLYQLNVEGAKLELESIETMMAEIEPHCRYSHLGIHERLEASKREEWAGELKQRAENILIGNATGIPHDQIETMRQHPDFNNKILPHILMFSGKLQMAKDKDDINLVIEAISSNNSLPLLED